MVETDSVEQELLEGAETVAVVGLSRDMSKDSHIVAAHMQRNGYRIIPIHPAAEEILGETAYPSLADLPEDLAAEVDLVNVFRPPEEIPGIVDEALEHLPNLQGVWTQKGLVHEEAARRVEKAGLASVQDRCLRTQHLYSRFGSGGSGADPQEADA